MFRFYIQSFRCRRDVITEATKSDTMSNQICKFARGNWIVSAYINSREISSSTVYSSPQNAVSESEEFMSFYPDVLTGLTDACSMEISPVVAEHMRNIANYNIAKGKNQRGLLAVYTYKMLESPKNLTMQNIKLANILGWCVEVGEASLFIQDDIIDGSETRRKIPCWYRVDDLGLKAVNDSLMTKYGVYTLLRKHFSGHQNYIPMLELFHEAYRKASYGQASDLLSGIDEQQQLGNFTMATYSTTAFNKTTFYTFTLPILLGMHLADKFDHEIYSQIAPLLCDMGLAYQVMDDFLDCFGDPKKTGKIGSDIRTGKCTWLALMALHYSSPTQRLLFEKNYGRADEESENEIRSLYKQLGLPKIRLEYATKLMDSILYRINLLPNERFPHSILLKELEPLSMHASFIQTSLNTPDTACEN